jgi:RNA polymerase sigma-70 factor (ECF subfamily)
LPLERDEEARLCLRAAGGDRRAFSALVAGHEKRLRAFLGRLAGPDLGDELAQQSFVKAWQGLRHFRGEARFGSWLCAIGWRCYSDHVRAERAEARKRESSAFGANSVERFSGDSRLDLDRALAALDPVECASLILCDGHGWSHVEAAAILGIPLGTLKGSAARAKRKCRAMLIGDDS